jgi:hypothetical protein
MLAKDVIGFGLMIGNVLSVAMVTDVIITLRYDFNQLIDKTFIFQNIFFLCPTARITKFKSRIIYYIFTYDNSDIFYP